VIKLEGTADYDVVTIRKRPRKRSPNFSTVVTELLNCHAYSEVYAVFCRSKWRNAPDWDPNKGSFV